MITAIIIDDEKRARINLELLIKEYCANIQIIDFCANLPDGVKAIRKNKPELVFLDIEMPEYSGLELLDFFDENEIEFKIIFITAYQQYAIQAFKLSAIDYLLKPINPDELIAAVNRFSNTKQRQQKYQLLKENIKLEKFSKIAVPTGNSMIFIEIDKIIFIKGEGAYAEINCNDNQKHLVSRNLKKFEEILCLGTNFVRTHKSYIVNTNYISAYNKSEGGSLELKNGLSLPISIDKIQPILEATKTITR